MNSFLITLQQLKLYWVIKILARLGYKRQGKRLEKIIYNKVLKTWVYTVQGFHFVSRGAGWVLDFDYLFDNLKKYSGYHYWPSKGDVVVDVGAGVGEETFAFSKLVGVEGKVFSIEAHPSTAAILKYGYELNDLKNVQVDNLAISDSNGLITIEDEDESYLRNTISNASTNGVQVSAVTLDHYIKLNKIDKINFLKVNIEGAEQLMIKGMGEGVGIIKNIAISCHDFRWAAGESEFYKTRDIILAFLQASGFRIIERQTGDVILDSYLYGEKP